MIRFNDLTGQRFGRLVAVERLSNNSRGGARWRCHCDCGATRFVRSDNLVSGRARSCGCLGAVGNIVHGKSRTKTYKSWGSMVQRCTNPSTPQWRNYGGRGITVCSRWQQFIFFLRDMGECPPGFSIERIDNSKGYEPGNCKWASRKEQARNTRANHTLVFNAKGQCARDWAEELSMNYQTLFSRLVRGWSVQDVLTCPVKKVGRKAHEEGLQIRKN